MSRRFHPFRFIIVAPLALFGAGGAVLALFLLRTPPGSPVTQEVSPPERPRAVPPELEAEYQDLGRARASGDFSQLAQRYPAFLEELARRWGAGHRDLALYHYDFCRSLLMASKPAEALAAAAKAIEAWPDCVPLQLLEARVRLQTAIPGGQYDARADQVLKTLLQRANHPRLRGLSVDPALLASQWADMLYQVGRYREALEAAETGLAANPRSLGCRTSKAQVLLSVERPQEALSMLRELAVERDTAPIELHLGMALLLSGEPAAAWERFSRLLKKERTRDEPAVLTDSLYAELQLQAARALNKLERPREAAEVCLERLLGEPECEPVLHQLASSARALGAAPGAGALDLRLRRIQPREALRESALRAHHAGQEALAAFQLAQAELSVDRTGEALKLLLEARKSFRRIPQLHLETARVQSLVGRDDLAEATLREGIRDCATAALFSELARLLAEQGGEGAAEARRILAGLPAGLPASGEGAEGRLDEAVHLTARRARAHLELGDVPGARGVLDGGGASVERDPAALLARAEAALFERRFDDARRLLAESYQNLPGGPAWAAALKTCLDAMERTEAGDGAPLAGFDPSDLLDHPRLLLHPALSGPRFERLRAAHRRRRDLLAASNGTAGRESLARWREVLALYQDLGAGRKAREAAWYLCSIFPDDLEASRFLVRALSSPEEVVLRLRVLKSALRLAPGDVELRSMFAGSRASLGLPGQP